MWYFERIWVGFSLVGVIEASVELDIPKGKAGGGCLRFFLINLDCDMRYELCELEKRG